MSEKSLSKLGRPLSAGSHRNKYLKFYLSLDEMNNFLFLEKNVELFFLSRGFKYSRADYFRAFLSSYDDSLIFNILFEKIKGAGENPQ